ncbi:MAG: tetratricopeptide repeat protein [Acidobacteriota bacterium]
MASKKNKSKNKLKHIRLPSAIELLQDAEEFVAGGHAEMAVQCLRRAEAELKPRMTPDGKRVTMPPHLVAAQAAWPAAMARAQAAHAPALTDPQQKLAALEDAVKLAPQEPRYTVALGACRLLQQKADEAYADFQRAYELSPNKLTAQARALGLLATGRNGEAAALLNQSPAEWNDYHQHLLAALSQWPDGETAEGSSLSQPLLRGLHHLAKGEPEKAREALALLPVLDRNPSRAETLLIAAQFFRSGEANFLAGRHREAIADWREAQRLATAHGVLLPWRERVASYCHRIAENALAENLPVAIEAWQLALLLTPGDKIAAANLATAHRGQAQQAWNEGRTEQAANLWQEMLQTNPQDQTLLRNSAIACERLERKTEAIGHWRALARLWRQQFKQRAAEEGFKEQLQRLEHHLLDLMTETGQSPQEQLDELEAALRFDPDNQNFRLEVAQLLMELGKPQKALKHLDQIIEQHGASGFVLSHKATALDMAGRTKEAGKIFEQAYTLDPADRNTQLGYLDILGREAKDAAEEDDLDLAIEICQRQLSIDDDYFPALGQLAWLYFTTGRKEDAKELLNRAAAKMPPKPQRQVAVGAIFLMNGHKKEAKAAFDRAVELEPSTECFLQIGMAYLEKGSFKEAMSYFDRAAETADLDMLLSIALSLYEAGKNKEGERYINRAKKLDPTHPLPYFIKAISSVSNPLELLFMSDKKRKELLKNFSEAEKRMEGRSEFNDLRQELAEVKKMVESAPSGPDGILGALGGLLGAPPPFLLDDEDEEDFGAGPFFDLPRSKRKKRK